MYGSITYNKVGQIAVTDSGRNLFHPGKNVYAKNTTEHL